MGIVIREDIEKSMRELKKFIAESKDVSLEGMSEFFTKRVDGYEEHMDFWKDAYKKFAQLLPRDNMKVLDLGCGTGLEIEEIWKLYPNTYITGVDMCRDMLDKLCAKKGDKKLKVVCEDYFKYDFGKECYDAVISFESLHHFTADKKVKVYKKIYNSLKEGSPFILGDYIACCDEEEQLLQKVLVEKRKKFNVPDDKFVHFDIPLTLEHEIEVLKEAGFKDISVPDSINGATLIYSVK